MSYLKFIEDRVQQMAEDLSGVLGLELTIVDEKLLRIAGTGHFRQHLLENTPENSVFTRVLETGRPMVNIRSKTLHCKSCANYLSCEEVGTLAAPILSGGAVIGVIGLCAFNMEQKALVEQKADSLVKVLEQLADSLAKDVENLTMRNQIHIGQANINELINSIDKGILIVGSEGEISYINNAALRALGIDILGQTVVGRPLEEFLQGFDPEASSGQEVYAEWMVGDRTLQVAYHAQEVMLHNEKVSTLISFDEQQRVAQIAARFGSGGRVGFEQIIGECEALQRVIAQAKIAARTDSTILITGESGTGKELFVKCIHASSRRCHTPLVSVNCSAIPESLMESELFGYERGTFTGADPRGKAGKFEQANGGTLFLDEIGDLPLHLQPKLLRVLQEREVVRIGGSKPVKLDIKVIAATHKDIPAMLGEGRFREDLYYRLNVIPLELPPLRERGSDILLCAQYFVKKICARLGLPSKLISHDVQQKLFFYQWPGNIREMENVLEYAVNFTEGGQIELENLPPYLLAPTGLGLSVAADCLLPQPGSTKETLQEMTQGFEQMAIAKYLEFYGDTTEGKKLAAQALGISLTTLYRKQ